MRGIVKTEYFTGLVVAKIKTFSGNIFYNLLVKEDGTGKGIKRATIKETDIIHE